MPKPNVHKGMPSVQLTKEEFTRRARQRFYDPTFTAVSTEIDSAQCGPEPGKCRASSASRRVQAARCVIERTPSEIERTP